MSEQFSWQEHCVIAPVAVLSQRGLRDVARLGSLQAVGLNIGRSVGARQRQSHERVGCESQHFYFFYAMYLWAIENYNTTLDAYV
jgi:hypothetical protein